MTTTSIQLNIGGTVFHTTKDTLRNSQEPTFFTSLVRDKEMRVWDAETEEYHLEKKNTVYFVDRDPTHFRHVLNYLRNTKLPFQFGRGQLPMLTELELEADFYQITTLSHALQRAIRSEQSRLKQLWQQKMEGVKHLSNIVESISLLPTEF